MTTTHLLHDPMFNLTVARWDCVNASGPCDCDNGVNATRVAAQNYTRKQREFPIEPRRPFGTSPWRDDGKQPERPLTRWQHLMKVIFG